MPASILRVLLFALIATACDDHAPATSARRAVAAEAIASLERALGPTPPPPPADVESTRRIRNRLEAISADTSPMRAVAVQGVHDFGDAAVPVLSLAIADSGSSAAQRATAAEMLAALDSPMSAAALVHHACDNPVAWIRAQCTYQLAQTSQDQVMIPLLEAIGSETDPEARVTMAGTLARFGCLAFESEDQASVRRWRTGEAGPEFASPAPTPRLQLAVWKCIARLGDASDASATVQRTVLLGRLPAFAAEWYVAALREEDAQIRAGVARALARMGQRASTAGAALLESLEFDPALEFDVIEALGSVRHAPAARAVEERLRDTMRPVAVRAAAARALAGLDAPGSVQSLIDALAAGEPPALRVAAAGSLIEYGRASEAVPVLVAALGSRDTEAAETALVRWLEIEASSGGARAGEILDQRRRPDSNVTRFAASIRAAFPEFGR